MARAPRRHRLPCRGRRSFFYSVPHRFARSEVEVRLTPQTIEIFLKGERIAAHRRGSSNHGHTTLAEHVPSSHRRYADWTIERIRRTAASIGPPLPFAI